MMLNNKRPLNIDELNANHYMVSVHKYGFFLCRRGTARIMLGANTYRISRNYLCLYAPDTFFQILEKSYDLEGILEEDEVEAYHQVLVRIDIRQRLKVRESPCVEITEAQADEIERLQDVMTAAAQPADGDELLARLRDDSVRYLRYVICLKVLEAYFRNVPVAALSQGRDDAILNRFLVSVYKNCHRERSVQYYADQQRLSPYYFSTIIRECSGKSAMQWIVNVTMTFVRQYLECTELSLKEIANRMNFPDQSTFGRYFKHHQGCSPSEYRARKSNITQ